jgi:hypothetical protein
MNILVYEYKTGYRIGTTRISKKLWSKYLEHSQKPQNLIQAGEVLTLHQMAKLKIGYADTVWLERKFTGL